MECGTTLERRSVKDQFELADHLPAVLALGSVCAWCARTLIGQQAINGRSDFR